MRSGFLLISCILLLLLEGCAQVPSLPPDSAKVCCSRYADFNFSPLTPGGEVRFNISESSPIFSFREGRSYFVALRLPLPIEKNELLIRAYPSSLLTASAWYYFPVVTFLDEQYGELESITDERFAFDLYGWSGHATHVAKIPVPLRARYAVIHTPKLKVGTTHTSIAEMRSTTYMFGTMVISTPGGVGKAKSRLGPIGPIKVTFQPTSASEH